MTLKISQAPEALTLQNGDFIPFARMGGNYKFDASKFVLASMIYLRTETYSKTETDQKFADLIGNAPAALDTINDLAAAMQADQSLIDTLNNAIGTKMSKAANGADIQDPSAFRTALQLGSAAQHAASDFMGAGASIPWNQVTNKPTTRDGYALSDVMTATEVASAIDTATAGLGGGGSGGDSGTAGVAGEIVRFPSGAYASGLPAGLLALTSAAQQVSATTYPNLAVALGKTNLGGGVSSPFTQSAKLIWPGTAADYDNFGNVLAVSHDGNYFAASAWGQEAVAVFIKNGSNWTNQTILKPATGVGFGRNGGIALSSDGSRLFVGARDYASEQGEVFVFKRTGATWSQEAVLTDSAGAANDYFGNSLAINAAGTRLFVGAYGKTTNKGAVIQFDFDGTNWSQTRTITPTSPPTAGKFGYTVALSYDGNYLAVSTLSGTSTDAVYVFATASASPTQQGGAIRPAALTAGNENFGASLAINADGSQLFIGCPGYDGGATDCGAVYNYIRTGTTWAANANSPIIPASGTSGKAGSTNGVTCSDDGNTLVIAAYTTISGRIYTATRSSATSAWTTVMRQPSSGSAVNDYFGAAIAISGNTSDLIVGCWNDNTARTGAGAVYDFSSVVAPDNYVVTVPAQPDTSYKWAMRAS